MTYGTLLYGRQHPGRSRTPIVPYYGGVCRHAHPPTSFTQMPRLPWEAVEPEVEPL